MAQNILQTAIDSEITDDMMRNASKLFSGHYGIWGTGAGEGKIGKRVRLPPSRIRSECLSLADGVITLDDVYCGHVLAARWKCQAIGKSILWITQLVVHSDYRRQGLATALLNELRSRGEDEVVGIASCHPAGLRAVANVWGCKITHLNLDFIRDNAEKILASAPVQYIRKAKLRGRLFASASTSTDEADASICTLDTNFFVNHTAPLAALAEMREREGVDWPLGALDEGREFLLMIEVGGEERRLRGERE